MFIQIDNLVKQYGRGETAVRAIGGIGLEVEKGDFVAIMGESGSGKSTLLSVMGALNSPTEGGYRVGDVDVYALGQDQRAEFRRDYLGFVFQSFNLIPYLTVMENVMLPLAIVKMKEKKKRSAARDALDRVGINGKAHRLPSEISGGEQERTAIARAIVNRPPILIADEPTGNLDSGTSGEIMALFQSLNNDGMTIIMVTHNSDCALYARKIFHISDGLLVEPH
ncbi:MAG: ABC transporter ATP-binding protein [Deltaproteobacteria bacterium]|nr:ABC transporter ATP-binding protein [Deltaproteobacteria bacterium]